MSENYGTIWVCQDCMLHHANGECGGCYENHDEEPLGPLDDLQPTAGMTQEGHSCGRQDDTYFGDCDCETNEYSTSQCEGCGSYLHGERHAMTLFKSQ